MKCGLTSPYTSASVSGGMGEGLRGDEKPEESSLRSTGDADDEDEDEEEDEPPPPPPMDDTSAANDPESKLKRMPLGFAAEDDEEEEAEEGDDGVSVALEIAARYVASSVIFAMFLSL